MEAENTFGDDDDEDYKEYRFILKVESYSSLDQCFVILVDTQIYRPDNLLQPKIILCS